MLIFKIINPSWQEMLKNVCKELSLPIIDFLSYMPQIKQYLKVSGIVDPTLIIIIIFVREKHINFILAHVRIAWRLSSYAWKHLSESSKWVLLHGMAILIMVL